MAKDQKNAAAEQFDLAKFLEGTDLGTAKDFRAVEGLTPAYVPEVAFAEGWEPVVGRLARVIQLPTLFEGTKNEFTPLAFEVILSRANKAVIGKRGEARRVVNVKVGEPILVFISGNLQTKRDLLQAALDPEFMYPIVMRVTGKEQINEMPSPMWVWETLLGSQQKKREGQYKLLNHDISLAALPAILKGEVPQTNAAPQAQAAAQA